MQSTSIPVYHEDDLEDQSFKLFTKDLAKAVQHCNIYFWFLHQPCVVVCNDLFNRLYG